MSWVGLISADGKTEINADFYYGFLGKKDVSELKNGQIVTDNHGKKWRVSK